MVELILYLVAGFAAGVVVGYMPYWITYWRLRWLLWVMTREARQHLAALRSLRDA